MTITLSKKTTRNVDVISSINNTDDFKPFVVDPASLNHLLESLINAYDNPVEAAFRETVSNAVDATVEANSTDPVRVTLPTFVSPFLVIKDQGVGMSMDTLDFIYRSWGNSTKTDNMALIGAKGMGSKSPLAISDSFTLETVKDGHKVIASVEQTSTGGGLSILLEEETDSSNGTTITIPVNEDQILLLEDVIKTRKYLFPVEVLVNDKSINWDVSDMISFTRDIDGHKITYRIITKEDQYVETGCVYFNVGGVVYNTKLPTDIFEGYLPYFWSFLIDLPNGSVTLPSSRDSIEMSKKSLDTLKRVIINEDPNTELYKLMQYDIDNVTEETITSLYKKWGQSLIKLNHVQFNTVYQKPRDVLNMDSFMDIGESGEETIEVLTLDLTTNFEVPRFKKSSHSSYCGTLGELLSTRTNTYLYADQSYVFSKDDLMPYDGFSKKVKYAIKQKSYYSTPKIFIVSNNIIKECIKNICNIRTIESLGDIDSIYSSRVSSYKPPNGRIHSSINSMVLCNEDMTIDFSSNFIDDLVKGQTYYVHQTGTKLNNVDETWWYNLAKIGGWVPDHKIIVPQPRKSLSTVKDVTFINIDDIKNDLLTSFANRASTHYILTFIKFYGKEVPNILKHNIDSALDLEVPLGVLKGPLTRLQRNLKGYSYMNFSRIYWWLTELPLNVSKQAVKDWGGLNISDTAKKYHINRVNARVSDDYTLELIVYAVNRVAKSNKV